MKKQPNHNCKHCGKDYYFCGGGYSHNYLDVACSPACYTAYQEAVLAARSATPKAGSDVAADMPAKVDIAAEAPKQNAHDKHEKHGKHGR